MKRALLGVAIILVLSACSRQETREAAAAPEREELAEAATKGPELGEWGVDTDNILETVKPGDDFYRHANGRWLETFKIPDEYSSYGSFTVLYERTEERVKEIIDDAVSAKAPAGSNEQKISDFYSSFINTRDINAKGLTPLAEDFATIDAAVTSEDILHVMAQPDIGAASPIGFFVSVDFKRPGQYITYLTQSGLGMPNRDYYLEERFADKRAKYQDYIRQMLSLADIEGAEEKAQAIFDLETKMAEIHWTPAKRRERDLTYNLKSLDELKAFAPDLPWDAFLSAGGLGEQTEFVVREDDAIARLSSLFAETPIETWRAYLKFHLLDSYADVLPAGFDEAHFEFFSTELRGVVKQKERWKRAVAALNGRLGEAIGKIYVERYFPPESKEQMNVLVGNTRLALKERLEKLDWMSDETKARALEKLEKFTAKIGYPDKWRDYSSLEIVKDDAYGNAKRAANFDWSRSLDKLGKPVDKTEWGIPPQIVNAYYSAAQNEIVFPAAILQAPFFDPAADPAVNYGAIGAVIGHEIGHGFDDQGRKSDGDGMLRDWWETEDADSFEKLADKLGAQYAQYEPIPGFPINPKLTMGENIGDIGGLAIAYHAYQLSLGGAEAPLINGYTGDQRFFLAWAQIWKRVMRDEQIKNQIASDPHSPAAYRVNGVVRNMDAWYAAFAVSPDDALYLPPEKRVQIW